MAPCLLCRRRVIPSDSKYFWVLFGIISDGGAIASLMIMKAGETAVTNLWLD